MKKAELIFIPLPGTSHLVASLEFAKRLMERDNRILITVLLSKIPFGHAITKSVRASHSSIRFIDLPQVDLPPPQLITASPEYYFSIFAEKNTPHVRNIVRDIVSSSSSANSDSDNSVHVTGLVVDHTLHQIIDVAIELGLSSYIFTPCSAGSLDLIRYLSSTRIDHQVRTDQFQSSYSDDLINIPGFVHPVPVSILPSGFFDKDNYTTLVKLAQRLKDVDGIIVNTFSELEQYMVNSFSGGLNTPVYTVGPLVNLQVQPNRTDLEEGQCQKILQWLDDQPECSVVYLCFGIAGSFGLAQVKEIAFGLEQSGYRFLWSLRVSPKNTYGNVDVDVLPGGFLERVRGRGMICGWSPQVEVLAHQAIGGFVSHCGWNSILESLWFGVPIVTWPLFAEQPFNAFTLVKELKLALEINLDSRKDGDTVTADEIARAVRSLMEGDSEIRKNVKRISEIGKKSLMDIGGSSFVSIGKFIDLNFSNDH